MTQNQSKRWVGWLAAVAVVVAAAAGAAWYWQHKRVDAPQFQTVPVARQDLTQLVTATGTINPVLNVQVGCQVSGRIRKLYVDFNSVVKSNQLIAEIDPSTYQAQVNQATADLANARANLELQVAEAKRSAELFSNNLVSGSDYDTANATRDEAAAMVQIKQAALTNSLANLGYCEVYSPVDGVVIARDVDVGQTVAASLSAPTLFQIANDLTKMQIDTSVAEADVGGVAEGQTVDFTVDAYPMRTFHGVVTQVRNSPTTVNNVVTYDCVIGVTNSDYKLKPGMTANVSIIVAQRLNALAIPNGALRFRPPDDAVVDTNVVAMAGTNAAAPARISDPPGRRNNGRARNERPTFRTVYVLAGAGDNAYLRTTQIRTGISDGISTEVVTGLDEGQPVVTAVAAPGTQAGRAANPFGGGGGFGRMR